MKIFVIIFSSLIFTNAGFAESLRGSAARADASQVTQEIVLFTLDHDGAFPERVEALPRFKDMPPHLLKNFYYFPPPEGTSIEERIPITLYFDPEVTSELALLGFSNGHSTLFTVRRSMSSGRSSADAFVISLYANIILFGLVVWLWSRRPNQAR
jgi:hypothetical protein